MKDTRVNISGDDERFIQWVYSKGVAFHRYSFPPSVTNRMIEIIDQLDSALVDARYGVEPKLGEIQ